MGYRGKLEAQEQARLVRAENMTLRLHRRHARCQQVVRIRLGPDRRPLCPVQTQTWRATLAVVILPTPSLSGVRSRSSTSVSSESALAKKFPHRFCVALYAGEGTKGDGAVVFANSDPRMVAFFSAWWLAALLHAIDESRPESVSSRTTASTSTPRSRPRGVRCHGRTTNAVPRSVPSGRRSDDSPNETRVWLRVRELRLYDDASFDHGSHPRYPRAPFRG